MRRRIIYLISMLLLGIGILLLIYPELQLRQSKITNSNLIDVVWGMMHGEYVDDELGLLEDGAMDEYSGIEAENIQLARQEYEELSFGKESETIISFEQKKEWLLTGDLAYGIVEIPKLEVYYTVVKGTSEDNIRIAIGHMNGTAHFGQVGNSVLVGENGGIQGEFFQRIGELGSEDQVIVTNMKKEQFVYQVYEQSIYTKEDWEKIEPNGTERLLTLLTWDTEKTRYLVIRCKLME